MTDELTVVPVSRVDASAVFEPTDFDGAMSRAKTLAASSLIQSDLQNKPADVLFMIMKGKELGLSMIQSVHDQYIVKGHITLRADHMVAMVKARRDLCEYFVMISNDDTQATFKTQRIGDPSPVEMTFTIEDARKMGVLSRSGGNWAAHPKAMLRARCKSNLARSVYEDVIGGVRSREEVMDDPEIVEVVASTSTPVAQSEMSAMDKLNELVPASEVAPEPQEILVTPEPKKRQVEVTTAPEGQDLQAAAEEVTRKYGGNPLLHDDPWVQDDPVEQLSVEAKPLTPTEKEAIELEERIAANIASQKAAMEKVKGVDLPNPTGDRGKELIAKSESPAITFD